VLDLGGTCIRSGYVNETGIIEPATFRSEKITASLATPGDLRDFLVQKITGPGTGQENYVLSVAGPISADNRVVRKYTNVLHDAAEIPLADMVEGAVRLQAGRTVHIMVIKDAVAATIAEMGLRGAAADRDEVISVILGTGTGGAPCRRREDGEIVALDTLADLGHYQVDMRNTEPCNCGSRGCVERQTSGAAVVRSMNRHAFDAERYKESSLSMELKRPPGEITGEDISWAAAERDEFVIGVLREAARPLSLLLKCIFTSHPDMTVVLVGGFALGAGHVFLDLLRDALMESGIPFVGRERLSRFVENRVLLGTVPAEETNLVGAGFFLLQEERRRANRENRTE
jgi:glucokinase